MSGIVAAHGPFDPTTGERMLARLSHRGPDGAAHRSTGSAWLGCQQLNIVDPEHGTQPVQGSIPGTWLVGDGEIYNHQRIRDRVGAAKFRTRSDLEAALLLFEKLGVAAFEELWGTFALAIASDDGSFAVTRDALGVAPLYWAKRDDTVIFASELKAFDEDWRPFVRPFPPGHAWTPTRGLVPGPIPPEGIPVLLQSRPHEDPPTWVFDALRETIVRSVERTFSTKTRVGVLLSGGVDSSIITAVAARLARERGEVLQTFAVGMAGSGDLAAAKLVAKHTGTEHHELVYDAQDAIELVPQIVASLESFDPALVHSAVPNFLVSKLAAQHVKVVLTGEGADELFAGYRHYESHDTGESLHAELVATLEGMSIGGLRRVDRVAAANGIEPRVPFLDLDIVELALALPPEWKITTADRPAKWLLRHAFDGWLPHEVLWRPKEQFGEGTGMDDVLRDHYTETVSASDLDARANELDPPIRTREELAYYDMFTAALAGIDAQQTVGRFIES